MASFRPEVEEQRGHYIGRVLSVSVVTIGEAVDALRAGGKQSIGVLGLSLALLLSGVAAGVLISSRWQMQDTTAGPASALTRQDQPDIVASTIQRLETERADLAKQIANLRSQIGGFLSMDAQQKSSLQDINQELRKERVASGILPLHGQGIVFTLNDSTDSIIPAGEDPANYIIHDYDLRDTLSTLWASGAEAVSINGERIVDTTSVYCVGTTILVNATRLSPPYVVRAIGDRQALENAIKGASQMQKLNQRAIIYDLPAIIEQKSDLLVPAYSGPVVFKYAEVGK